MAQHSINQGGRLNFDFPDGFLGKWRAENQACGRQRRNHFIVEDAQRESKCNYPLPSRCNGDVADGQVHCASTKMLSSQALRILTDDPITSHSGRSLSVSAWPKFISRYWAIKRNCFWTLQAERNWNQFNLAWNVVKTSVLSKHLHFYLCALVQCRFLAAFSNSRT